MNCRIKYTLSFIMATVDAIENNIVYSNLTVYN